MIKFRNAWVRFFTWMASWFQPEPKPIPISEREMDARDLIGLCIRLRNQQEFNARKTTKITADHHLALLSEQMEESAPIAPRIYRSASFRFCQDQVSKDYAEQRRIEKQPLKLKVEK